MLHIGKHTEGTFDCALQGPRKEYMGQEKQLELKV